jgi:osmotically-inducible protein OsmY
MKTLLLAVTLVSVAAGCNRQDSQRLARVGKKIVEKAEQIAGGTQERLVGSLQNVQDNAGLAAHVASRLRWDVGVADADITVRVQGNVVELRGSAESLRQRRRAVELAETTVGVARVDDLIVDPETKRD